MIICKDGCWAYCGATVTDAYDAYLNSDDDHSSLSPSELEWYSATEMKLAMTLTAKQKPTLAPKKTAVKK